MAQKKDNSNTLIIVALVVALGIGGYFYWRSKQVKPQKEILKDIFENLTFETGKAIIKNSSLPYLDELVVVLKKAPDWQLKIVGHTDNQGSDQINLSLSKKRAEAVKEYLIKSGVVNQIVSDGLGESKPLADNNTPEGREKNRRVEFYIKKPDNTILTTEKK
jgi:outer membrane protein OmpA-like peptidoglycan-associated protein